MQCYVFFHKSFNVAWHLIYRKPSYIDPEVENVFSFWEPGFRTKNFLQIFYEAKWQNNKISTDIRGQHFGNQQRTKTYREQTFDWQPN